MALSIVHQDLSTVSADVVVLPSNTRLHIDGGAGLAVAQVAGLDWVQDACNQLGGCAVGQAKVTPAFDFPARYLIHAVGPVWQGGKTNEAELLSQTYIAALQLAENLGCISIALPLIGGGAFGFPHDVSLSIASRVLGDFCESCDVEVTLCLYGEQAGLRQTQLFRSVADYVHRIDEGLSYQRYRRDAVAMPQARETLPCPEYSMAPEPKQRERRRFSLASIRLPFSGERREEGRRKQPAEAQHADAMPFVAPVESEEALLSAPAPEPCSVVNDFSAVCAGCGNPIYESNKFCSYCGRALDGPCEALEVLLNNLDESFATTLFKLIDASGMTDAQVYRRANMSRQLFSKIRSNADYRPKKATAVALCIALRLTLPQTRDLLSRAGYSLTHASKFDTIVEYFIVNGDYDMFKINAMLFAHDQEILGCK